MLSTIYVACLSALSAFASPVQHNPRGFASSFSNDATRADSQHYAAGQMGPFGGGFVSGDQQSSSSTHNSGTTIGGIGLGGGFGAAGGIGGGFGAAGGIGGGFGAAGGIGGAAAMNSMNSMSANSMTANSISAGGMGLGGLGGIGGGGFAMSQQSSSVSAVTSSFQMLNSMMSQMQSSIMAGQMSQSMAIQRVQLLAQYFQMAMAQANVCSACFGGQSQFGGIASSTMHQFTSFMSQLHSTFGANSFGQILSPFANLGGSFSSFFHQAFSSSSSSFSYNSLIPPAFPSLIRGVMPGLPSILGQFNKK